MMASPPLTRPFALDGTFLRWHLARERDRDFEGILAVGTLHDRLTQQAASEGRRAEVEGWLREHIHSRWFFDASDLYRRLGLRRLGTGEPETADNLTAVLEHPDRNSQAGVLLQSGTGAGKTLTLRRTFLDC